jgi:hypothetical protein
MRPDGCGMQMHRILVILKEPPDIGLAVLKRASDGESQPADVRSITPSAMERL